MQNLLLRLHICLSSMWTQPPHNDKNAFTPFLIPKKKPKQT